MVWRGNGAVAEEAEDKGGGGGGGGVGVFSLGGGCRGVSDGAGEEVGFGRGKLVGVVGKGMDRR